MLLALKSGLLSAQTADNMWHVLHVVLNSPLSSSSLHFHLLHLSLFTTNLLFSCCVLIGFLKYITGFPPSVSRLSFFREHACPSFPLLIPSEVKHIVPLEQTSRRKCRCLVQRGKTSPICFDAYLKRVHSSTC